MLTKSQWLAFRQMCSVGHHLSPLAKPYAASFTVDEWKSLKRWPVALWESSPFAYLSVTDKLVEQTVKSWQDWHTVTLKESTTRLMAVERPFPTRRVDGILGPVTIDAAMVPRCGCPDYRPDEAVAEGNWRPECRGALSWALKDGGFGLPGLTQAQVTQAFELAYEYHHRSIEGVKFVRDDSLGTRANTFSRPARLGGSTLARHTLPPSTGTACSFAGWGEYDSDRRWSALAYFVAVIIHEEGHGLGCDHVRQSSGGVMTPGINSGAVERVRQWIADKATAGAFNAADWQELASKGDQRTTPPDDPDPPVPPTPVGKVALQGRITAIDVATGADLGQFIMVPADG